MKHGAYLSDFVQFPDAKSGEWFGYLTQEGKVSLDFKGGPFKGKQKEKKNITYCSLNLSCTCNCFQQDVPLLFFRVLPCASLPVHV